MRSNDTVNIRESRPGGGRVKAGGKIDNVLSCVCVCVYLWQQFRNTEGSPGQKRSGSLFRPTTGGSARAIPVGVKSHHSSDPHVSCPSGVQAVSVQKLPHSISSTRYDHPHEGGQTGVQAKRSRNVVRNFRAASREGRNWWRWRTGRKKSCLNVKSTTRGFWRDSTRM